MQYMNPELRKIKEFWTYMYEVKWRCRTGKRDIQLNPGYTHNMANTNAQNASNLGSRI